MGRKTSGFTSASLYSSDYMDKVLENEDTFKMTFEEETYRKAFEETLDATIYLLFSEREYICRCLKKKKMTHHQISEIMGYKDESASRRILERLDVKVEKLVKKIKEKNVLDEKIRSLYIQKQEEKEININKFTLEEK